MPTAAAYIRVSDKRQDEYSPESQLKLIRNYAARSGYELPEEYVFYDDGISAKSTKKRDAFRDMIALAKDPSHPFSAILVWKFSRFARNQEESIVYKAMLKRAGVSVISVSEPIPEDAFGSLIERIIEWMDEYYLIRLSPEVKRGMTIKAGRGEPMSQAAFGYTFDKTNKVYVPDPATAPAVPRIFRAYLSGVGMREIARTLTAEGYRSVRGNPIDNRMIDYILHNPVYIGKIRWSPAGRTASARDYDSPDFIITPGNHEPLVSQDLWDAVRLRLAEQKRRYGPYQRPENTKDWMLKGLVRCSACGGTLVRSTTSCPSMQCHNYARGSCNTSHSLSINKANRLVTESLRQLVDNAALPLAPEIRTVPADGPDYNKLLAQIDKKLARLSDAYLSGVYTLDQFKALKAALDRDAAAITAEKEKAAAAAPFDPAAYRQQLRSVLQIIEDPSASEPAKAAALRSVISSITYNKPAASLDIHFYA